MAADPVFLAGETLPAGKLAALSPNPTAFTPTWTNVTLGTLPVSEGVWWRVGREITFCARFILGTGGSTVVAIEMDLPVPADPAFFAMAVGSAWSSPTGPTNRYAGTFIISATRVLRIVGQATTTGWGGTAPHTWAAGSQLVLSGSYIAEAGA